MISKISFAEGSLKGLPNEEVEELLKNATPLSSVVEEAPDMKTQIAFTSILAIEQAGTRKDGATWTGTSYLLKDDKNTVFKSTSKAITDCLRQFEIIAILDVVKFNVHGETFEIHGRKAMKLSLDLVRGAGV